MKLTPHFSLAEMQTTSTGLSNNASSEAIARMRAVCSAVLEPWRESIGALEISSGYRSDEVNAAVGGSSSSQHCLGEAADVVPLDRPEAWSVLLEMMDWGLPVDQAIIYEGTTHIHISHTARHVARRDVMVKTLGGKYVPWSDYHGPLK